MTLRRDRARPPKCAALVLDSYRCQQHWYKRCEADARFKCNDVPLCGTHVNHPPERVIAPFHGGIVTTEAL